MKERCPFEHVEQNDAMFVCCEVRKKNKSEVVKIKRKRNGGFKRDFLMIKLPKNSAGNHLPLGRPLHVEMRTAKDKPDSKRKVT